MSDALVVPHAAGAPDDELRAAAAAVLEQLAFIFTMGDDAEDTAEVAASAAVAFRGPLSGELMIRVSAALLPTLATNMLGADGTPDEATQRDALGEVANVVCGNLLPRLCGRSAVFSLAAPRIAMNPAEDGPHHAARVRLALDEGSAELCLTIAPPAKGTAA